MEKLLVSNEQFTMILGGKVSDRLFVVPTTLKNAAVPTCRCILQLHKLLVGQYFCMLQAPPLHVPHTWCLCFGQSTHGASMACVAEYEPTCGMRHVLLSYRSPPQVRCN